MAFSIIYIGVYKRKYVQDFVLFTFENMFLPVHKFWKITNFEHFYALSHPRVEVFGKL